MTQAQMVRVNTRVSKKLNEWLDEQSAETGMAKSTLIMLALENFYREKEVMKRMADMGALVKGLEDMKTELLEAVQRKDAESRA